jgi:hypothetical protein
MMIKIKILALLLLFCVASCKQSLSQEQQQKIQSQLPFWQNRTAIINKNKTTMEYPITKETTLYQTEQRTNRIYIDNMECQFEIFVDDVLLLKIMGEITKRGGGINGDYDINQLMLTSGKHEVKVRMYPKHGQAVFGEEGYVNLTFSYFKNRDLRTMQYNEAMKGINGIHLDQLDKQWVDSQGKYGTDSYVEAHYKSKTPLPLKGLPAYEWRGTFEAEVPFSYIGWRNSVNLKKEQDDEKKNIKSELLAAYKKIYDIIDKRDFAAYLNLVKEREDLVTTALYYKDGEKKLRSDEFIKLIQNEDYELEPLFEETFQLEFQGYGKLAMLLHKADGEGIIRLKNKKNPDDNVYLDFRFQRKKKGDMLTVI